MARKKKKGKKNNKKKKGVVRYGDTVLWTPTWRGGNKGKRWSTRLQEIQEQIASKPSISPPVTKRRPKET